MSTINEGKCIKTIFKSFIANSVFSSHEMADMLGVTPESVSRILAEFKRNEILHKKGSQSDEIYEIDSQKLHVETLH